MYKIDYFILNVEHPLYAHVIIVHACDDMVY